MPRILRIINRFNLGGPTHNAAYLTRYLAPEFETLLVGGQWDESEEGSQHILEAVGVRPLILPEMRRDLAPWRDRDAYRRIRSLIKEFKPDIVHTHAAKAGAVGRYAASELKVPAVVHTFHGHVFHSYFGPVKTAFYKNIERYLARRSDRIVAISERQKHELVEIHRICPADKVRVVPLGFDLAPFQQDQETKRTLFRRAFDVGEGEIAIGIIGRFVPVKDHDLFIDAVASVIQRTHRRLRVFLIGDGEERPHIERRLDALGLDRVNASLTDGSARPATVTLTSWVKEMDIVMAGLDIVALTSLNEGTPVTLIEAQAANRPVVSTEVGGIANVVLPDRTALLSPPGDREAFAANLHRLVEDDALRSALGGGGWVHVHERFHFSRLVDDMAGLYRELLN
jgi:glycosyltransferase involved in cell wall biosynthesis